MGAENLEVWNKALRLPNSKEHLALLIDNEVAWMNPRLAAHLPVKMGERDPSISFLVSHEGLEPDTSIEIRPGHARAGINPAGRQFELKDYPYTHHKGIGNSLIDHPRHPMWNPDRHLFGFFRKVWGLCDLQYAIHDAEITEKLLKAGVQMGCVTSSISRLKQVPVSGKNGAIELLSETAEETLSEILAKRLGPDVFSSRFVPAIQKYHYSWPIRVRDLTTVPRAEVIRLIDETIAHVSKKLQRPLTYSDYLFWFAENLGTNIGRMHRAGYFHNYIQDHNVQTDGGIVDTDWSKKLSKLPILRQLQKRRDRKTTLKDTLDFTGLTDASTSTIVGAPQVLDVLLGAFMNSPDDMYMKVHKVRSEDLEHAFRRAYKSAMRGKEK